MTLKTNNVQLGVNVTATKNIVLASDESTGDLVISNGNHDGALTEMYRFPNGGGLRDSVSVKDFGAVGDGVTDDTVAIQAAIDSMSSGANTVVLSKGDYLITATINIPHKLKLIGAGSTFFNNGGAASTLRKAASLSGPAIYITGAGTSLEQLAIQGVTGNSGVGIQITAGRVYLRDVGVFNMGGDGIRVGEDAGGVNCNLWRLDQVYLKNNLGNGLYVSEGSTAAADANGGTATHLDIQTNTLSGVFIGSAQLNSFYGTTCQNNLRYGFEFAANARNNAVFGGDVESNFIANVRLDAGSVDNYIAATTFGIAQVSMGTPSDNYVYVPDAQKMDKGLRFPSVAVASTDPNTLDDYEEFGFGPTLDVIGVTNGLGVTAWTTRVANATKIGNRVFVTAALTWTANSGTGPMRITGLPFVSAATNGRTAFTIATDTLTYGTGTIIAYLENNTDYLSLYLQSSGANDSAVAIDTAGTIYLNFNYVAA